MYVVFLFLFFSTGQLFSFTILEKGVGPWSFEPSLASNSLTWMIAFNQDGNVAGPIAYSFFDKESNRMSNSKIIPGLVGIKPQIKINNRNRGTMLVDTTKGSLVGSSFRGIPPLFTAQVAINTKTFPNSPDLYFQDSGFGFCVFKNASSQIFYSFYDATEQAFIQAQSIPQIQVGNTLLCAGVAEQPLIVFSDLEKNQLFYGVYNSSAQTFSPFKIIAGSEDSCNASLFINKQGKGIITWNTGSSTSLAGKIGYSFFDQNSLSFSQALFLDQETKGFNPTAQINQKGVAILCWTRLTSNGKNSLAYALLNQEKNAFDTPRFFQGASLYPSSCQVSLNENNQAIACWFATLSGRIEYAYFDLETKTFTPALFIKESGINSQFPKVDFIEDRALMVWSVFGGVEYAYFDKNNQKFSSAAQLLPASINEPNAVSSRRQQE